MMSTSIKSTKMLKAMQAHKSDCFNHIGVSAHKRCYQIVKLSVFMNRQHHADIAYDITSIYHAVRAEGRS